MEYVGGENLQQKLASIGKFSIERTVQIGLQVVHALSYIHQLGFVHCDLKTANILLEEDSDEIRIIDFGVARSMPASTCLKPDAKEIAGSPLYMSPEQLAGRPVDERSDIFSLGVLLYELVSGRKPFESDSMEEISLVIRHYDPEPLYQFLEAIPPLLNHLIEKCLEKNPFSRYQSAGKCGVALQQIDQCINRSVSQCGNPHGHRNLNEE
jgi:serine/threonine-protein kinase